MNKIIREEDLIPMFTSIDEFINDWDTQLEITNRAFYIYHEEVLSKISSREFMDITERLNLSNYITTSRDIRKNLEVYKGIFEDINEFFKKVEVYYTLRECMIPESFSDARKRNMHKVSIIPNGSYIDLIEIKIMPGDTIQIDVWKKIGKTIVTDYEHGGLIEADEVKHYVQMCATNMVVATVQDMVETMAKNYPEEIK